MTFAQPFAGYEILAKVGSGSMGTVFKARQKHMNRLVALKVLRPSLARNEKYVERLRREARIVGALNHPNIVTGYDLGEEGGYHYFVMEFVEGKSLRALLAEWGFFPEERVLDVGIRVTEALDHAFQQGVIHRDIKPGNILIDEAGRVKLTDMGLAKGPTDLTLTRDGATVGTPQFISPEQARDPQSADVRSDLYSLGATLFQMATGSAPLTAQTIGELIHQVLHEPAPLASDLNPALSEGLSAVIKKLLMKDPALRYQTPAELLEDLRRVRDNERPGVDLRKLEGAERRHRVGVRWPVAVAVLIAVGVGIFFAARTLGEGAPDALPGAAERAFRDELDAALARAADARERLAVVARFRSRASGAGEQRIVDEAEARTLSAIRGELERCAADVAAPARIDAWITATDRWSASERYASVELERVLRERTGLSAEGVPGRLSATWARGIAGIDEVVAARVAVRDEGYVRGLDRDLTERVAPLVASRLTGDQFEDARRVLRAETEAYHDRVGGPGRNRLGEPLATLVHERESAFVATWTARIDSQERRVADDLAGEVEDEVAAVRLALGRQEDPAELRRRVESFRRRRLVDQYPARTSFSDAVDPWPAVDADLSRLLRDVEARQREQQNRELTNFLGFAYRVLADAGVEEAFDLVRERAARDELERAMRHASLLRSAREVRDMVFDRLLVDRASRIVPVRNGRVKVVRGGDGRYALLDANDDSPLAFSVVAAALLETVTAGAVLKDVGEDPLRRAGLALWQAFAGDIGAANALLKGDPAWLEFFVADVYPLVTETPLRRFGAPVEKARRMLAEATRAREKGDAGSAQYWLERLDAVGFDSLAEAERGVRNEIVRWIARVEERQQRLRALRAGAPEGAVVRVSATAGDAVEYPLAALAGVELNDAWERLGDGMRYTVADPPLDAAWERRLELPLLLDARRGLDASVELSFERSGSVPQLVMLSISGAGCVVAVLPSGAVVAEVVDSKDLRRADVLRRVLAGALAAAADHTGPWVVPGARHRVELSIAGVGRTTLRVQFDGDRVADGRVQLGGGDGAAIAVVPMQPLRVNSVRVADAR